VTLDKDLRELDVGSWSGRSRDEIHAEDPDALDLYFQGKVGWHGGETYEEHEARAEAFAKKMLSLPDPSVVVAVTHGGTLRALVLALLEQDHSNRRRLSGTWHTGIAHLERGRHGYFLTAYNADARSLAERYGSQRTA
jgi:broad specificity phosphatase PhoE